MDEYQIPQELLDLIVSCKSDAMDTVDIQIQKYKTLIHCRHDLIHSMCNLMLGVDNIFGKNDYLEQEFGSYMPDSMKRLSPDIVYVNGRTCIVADVACTANRQLSYNEKNAKYSPVISFLRHELKMNVPDLELIWVHPGWGNLDEALSSFFHFCGDNGVTCRKVSEFQKAKHRLAYELISEETQKLSILLPGHLLTSAEVDFPPVDHMSVESLYCCAEQNFPLVSNILSAIDEATLADVEENFTKLVQDEEVVNHLKDSKHDETMFSRAFKELEAQEKAYPQGDVKPSLFIPFAGYDQDILDELTIRQIKTKTGKNITSKLSLEQRTTLQFLDFLSNCPARLDKDLKNFLRNLYGNLRDCLDYSGELNLYNTGLMTGSAELERVLNKEYTSHRHSKDGSVSKRDFFCSTREEATLKPGLPQIFRNKSVKVPAETYRYNPFVVKAGTSYRKSHTSREYKEKKTVGFDEYTCFEEFLDLLYGIDPMPYRCHPFIGGTPGVDDETCTSIKDSMLGRQRTFMSNVQTRYAHSLSKHSSHIATQLLHFNEMNTTDNTFCVINSGRQNCVHIVQGGSVKRGGDVGQAFFTIFLTDDKGWASKVYGKVTIYEVLVGKGTKFLCVTPWVRLTCERLSFMKDQYYSTLSTSYDSWSRTQEMKMDNELFKHIYSFRVLVSLCPSQKVAELLMDTRYIFMASLSTYSNVFKLILDKFAPPYKNCFEQYIVRQLKLKCEECVVHLKSYPPEPNKPGFSGTTRLATTLGGSLSIPSLWSGAILTDLQSIFDDVFVYVHTSKETTSEYHEQVKAMNTILKYQNIYDTLAPQHKAGLFSTKDLKHWLLSGCQVGCHAPTIYVASRMFSEKFKGLYRTSAFQHSCEFEPLSEIVSTKACIPELDRRTVIEERSKEAMERMKANIGSLISSQKGLLTEPILVRNTFFKIDLEMTDDLEIVPSRNLRVKVHDALIDWVGRHGEGSNYVIDLAYWNINKNKCKVLTDTCIKAQYGAKREFYVINLGAKAMARVTENCYKKLAVHVRNEMISVPGDRKLKFIQEAVSDIILASERHQDKIFYVNGDCTKWSACETLSSFIAMNEGLLDVFGKQMTAFNTCVFSSWANKEIQIPQSILKNVNFVTEHTKYIDETTTIKSTQNFLQGMFNYSSSLKAVIATEFAIHMFKRNNPSKFLACSHLEHSDDYSLTVRVTTDQDFELFRVYHKLSQKLFGINDSEKKTNVQKNILEFISLFSYNGQLYYPHIKKTKEVGTNLSCTSYRSDVMAIGSRVSEACRYGVPLDSCYFMQRVHCCSIADAYSTSPGMRNGKKQNVNLFNLPLETFGLPDCLPLVYNLTRGNPDNYRVFKFGNKESQSIVKKLYLLNLAHEGYDDLPTYNSDESLGGFYHPQFKYPMRNNRLKAIKSKIRMDYQGAMDYFEHNITDSLVKPVEVKRFRKWLQAMYYNKSFSQAYMRVSRSAMTLRHSLFSSKPCIQSIHSTIDLESEKVFLTVEEYLDEFQQLPDPHEMDTVHLTDDFNSELCLNNSNLETFYEYVKGMAIIPSQYTLKHTTVIQMPGPNKWLQTENPASHVLQFMVNYENFKADRRTKLSDTSIQRDVNRITALFSKKRLIEDPKYCRSVLKRVNSQKQPSSFGIVFETSDVSVVGYIRQYLNYGMVHGATYNFAPRQLFKVPQLSGLSIIYRHDWKTNSDIYTQALSYAALAYRAIVLQKDLSNMRSSLENLLDRKIVDLDVTLKELLERTTHATLRSFNVGELTIRCHSFLKAKLLLDYSDLRAYVGDNLFYEVHYLKGKHLNEFFHEGVIIKFQHFKCRAYRYKQNVHDFLVMECPHDNKVGWFYMYTIAQRAFGLISQREIDLRFAHSHEMKIPKIPKGMTYVLKELVTRRSRASFFKQHGHVIQSCDIEEAELPIVVQKVSMFGSFAKETLSSGLVDLNVGLLQVTSSKSTPLFKLPFGNLPCVNTLEVMNPKTEDIFLDGMPLYLLQASNRLELYLKTKLDAVYTQEEIEANSLQLYKIIKSQKGVKGFSRLVDMNFDASLFERPYEILPGETLYTKDKTIRKPKLEFKEEVKVPIKHALVATDFELPDEDLIKTKEDELAYFNEAFAEMGDFHTFEHEGPSLKKQPDPVMGKEKEPQSEKETGILETPKPPAVLGLLSLDASFDIEIGSDPGKDDHAPQEPMSLNSQMETSIIGKQFNSNPFEAMGMSTLHSSAGDFGIEIDFGEVEKDDKEGDALQKSLTAKPLTEASIIGKQFNSNPFEAMGVDTLYSSAGDFSIELDFGEAEDDKEKKTKPAAKQESTPALGLSLGLMDFGIELDFGDMPSDTDIDRSKAEPVKQAEVPKKREDPHIKESVQKVNDFFASASSMVSFGIELDLNDEEDDLEQKGTVPTGITDIRLLESSKVPETKEPGNPLSKEALLGLLSYDTGDIVIPEDEDNLLGQLDSGDIEIGSSSKGPEYLAYIERVKLEKQVLRHNVRLNEIEESRGEIVMGELYVNELGGLYEINDEEVYEVSQHDSESSSSSNHSGDASYFQLVEQRSTFEGLYHYEQRCREAMLTYPEYLLTNWYSNAAQKILKDETNLSLFIRLLSFTGSQQRQVEITKTNKAVQALLLEKLRSHASSVNTAFRFDNDRAIWFRDNKLKFIALGRYSTPELKRDALKRKPQLKSVSDVNNDKGQIYWAALPLGKKDLHHSLHRRVTQNDRIKDGGPVLNLIDAMLPKIEMVQNDFLEDYDF